MSDVIVYAAGLVTCSVCADAALPREEVERSVNLQFPTGISSQWRVSSDPTFIGGQPNPCPCEQDPSRLHYLLEC